MCLFSFKLKSPFAALSLPVPVDVCQLFVSCSLCLVFTNCCFFYCTADSLGQTAAAEYELAVRSLGAVVWHLKHCLMDHELLSLCSFTLYKPETSADADQSMMAAQPASFTVGNVHMVCLSVFCFLF